jgi:hypothetical protein
MESLEEQESSALAQPDEVSLALISIFVWHLFPGDDLGNLTALSLDNWIDRLGPQRDHTGGCINERESHTIPCPVSAQAAGAVHAIIQITD